MKKLSEELAEMYIDFRNEEDTEEQRERFDELMTLLDSAPELLEALKELLGEYTDLGCKRYDEYMALIAKAEGRDA